jgi:hypothetical protein
MAIRGHQRRLKSNGVELTSEADENGGGPILVDQHV